MARISFDEIEQWESRLGLKRAETARRLGVTSQTLNGWRVRGQVSADESDRVRALVSSSVGAMCLTTSQGSTSEPALPNNLSPMAKDCITRIAAAAARAGGKFDDLLVYIAAEIERTADLPLKSTKKVRPASKHQLSLVKTVSMMGGLIPDAQAASVENILWGYIRLEDPDAKIPVINESRSLKPDTPKKDLLKMAVDTLHRVNRREGRNMPREEIARRADRIVQRILLSQPKDFELTTVFERYVKLDLKETA